MHKGAALFGDDLLNERKAGWTIAANDYLGTKGARAFDTRRVG